MERRNPDDGWLIKKNVSLLNDDNLRDLPDHDLENCTPHSGFPGGSVVKESANVGEAGDSGSIPGSGSGGGNGNPLKYSCLEILWTEEPGELQFIGLQRVASRPSFLSLQFLTPSD